MNFDTNKEKGNTGLALAIGYYGSHNYTISIPLNDTQDYDLIIDNGEQLQKVQVKATSQRNKYGISMVSLKSMGGTAGKIYKTVKDTNIDILFVVTELGELYEIPFSEIDNVSSMNLGKDRQKYRVDNIFSFREEIINVSKNKIVKYNDVSIKNCSKCNEPIGSRNKTGLCLKCSSENKRITDRPNKEELLQMLKDSNFSAVGRKYGVSDNAIRKWCKSYGLPTSAKEIKSFELEN